MSLYANQGFGYEDSNLGEIIRDTIENHPVLRRLAGRQLLRRGSVRRAIANKFADADYDEDTGEENDLRSMITEALEEHPLFRRMLGRRLVRRGLARRAIANKFADTDYDEDTDEETDLRSMITEALEEHPLFRRMIGRRLVRRGLARRAIANKFADTDYDEDTGEETDLRSMIKEVLEEHPVFRRMAGRRLLRRGLARRAIANKLADIDYGNDVEANYGGDTGEEMNLRSTIKEFIQEHPLIRRMAGRGIVRRGLVRRAISNKFAGINEGNGDYEEFLAHKGPKGWKRSDEKIKEDICESLFLDDDIDASDIEVKVQNGIATLSGSTTDRWTKHAAEECAENVFGVEDVKNEIVVHRGETMSHISKLRKDKVNEKSGTSLS